jgi:hypothetical protein
MTVRQKDRTCCATSSTLGSRRGGNEPSSSLLTMYPSLKRDCPTREGRPDLPASGGKGARVRWYGEHMQTLDKRRYVEQAKDADRLEPKGIWRWYWDFLLPQSWTQRHRRRESDLTHLVIQTEHGKPIVLPLAGRKPQGVPTGLWVWEEGKSEGRAVMTRIGVAAASGCSHHPTRKRADFPLVSYHERT